MLNKKGFTLVEVIIVLTVMFLIFGRFILPNVHKNKQNQKDLEQSQEFNNRFPQDLHENNRFIITSHGETWGKRIRVDIVQDNNTGKSYIIFRGYNNITALEIK